MEPIVEKGTLNYSNTKEKIFLGEPEMVLLHS